MSPSVPNESSPQSGPPADKMPAPYAVIEGDAVKERDASSAATDPRTRAFPGTPLSSPVGAGDPLRGSRKRYSRLIGALFLAGFVVYGVGFSLVSSVTGAPDFLSTVSAHQSTLVLGAFLMLLNTVVDVGKAVLFFPILENHGKRTALAYLTTMIVEVVLLDLGAISLLMIAPLAQQGAPAGQPIPDWATTLGSLAVQANAMAYQIAEMSLGLGCIFLFSLLLRTGLIPRFLSIWGLAGYVILMAGAIAEIFGIHIGLMFSIPGGLLEIVLGVWLLIKGFEPKAYSPTP